MVLSRSAVGGAFLVLGMISCSAPAPDGGGVSVRDGGARTPAVDEPAAGKELAGEDSAAPSSLTVVLGAETSTWSCVSNAAVSAPEGAGPLLDTLEASTRDPAGCAWPAEKPRLRLAVLFRGFDASTGPRLGEYALGDAATPESIFVRFGAATQGAPAFGGPPSEDLTYDSTSGASGRVTVTKPEPTVLEVRLTDVKLPLSAGSTLVKGSRFPREATISTATLFWRASS